MAADPNNPEPPRDVPSTVAHEHSTPAPPSDARPPGFVHIDADGIWTLAACYGYDERDTLARDPLYRYALPRLLGLFDRLNVRATFFIVGRDLEVDWKREFIGEIAMRGHEIANHSYSHPIGLETLRDEDVLEEISSAQEIIERHTGRRPIGFRSPGYDGGDKVLRACARLGLRYEGSLLPTPLAPALRFAAGRLRRRIAAASGQPPGSLPPTYSVEDPSAARAAASQYGHYGLRLPRLNPEWARPVPGAPPVLRLPLAVSPRLGLPLHPSLGIILGRRRTFAGLRRAAAHGWPMTLLLHLMDLADPNEVLDDLHPVLAADKAFRRPLAERLDFVESALTEFMRLRRIERTADYITRVEPPVAG